MSIWWNIYFNCAKDFVQFKIFWSKHACIGSKKTEKIHVCLYCKPTVYTMYVNMMNINFLCQNLFSILKQAIHVKVFLWYQGLLDTHSTKKNWKENFSSFKVHLIWLRIQQLLQKWFRTSNLNWISNNQILTGLVFCKWNKLTCQIESLIKIFYNHNIRHLKKKRLT